MSESLFFYDADAMKYTRVYDFKKVGVRVQERQILNGKLKMSALADNANIWF